MAISFAFGFQFNPEVKMSSLSRAHKSVSRMLLLPGEVKHRDLKAKRQPSRMTCSSMMIASMMGRTEYPAPWFEKKKLIQASSEQRELCFDTKRRQIMQRQTFWKSHFMKMTIMTAALIFIK